MFIVGGGQGSDIGSVSNNNSGQDSTNANDNTKPLKQFYPILGEK